MRYALFNIRYAITNYYEARDAELSTFDSEPSSTHTSTILISILRTVYYAVANIATLKGVVDATGASCTKHLLASSVFM